MSIDTNEAQSSANTGKRSRSTRSNNATPRVGEGGAEGKIESGPASTFLYDGPGKLAASSVSVDDATVIRWYRLHYQARQIDERATRYARRAMGWSYHARCGGHEGIQVALGSIFRQSQDWLFPYYRDGALALAAGLSPYEMFLNGLMKDQDPGAGGRHMSNHFAKPAIRVQNVSSCTGNHTLHGVGVARAIRYYGKDEIAYTSQGESSTSEGYCYEAYNGASLHKLPVCFVIQENGYGISVPTREQTANVRVGDNYRGLMNLKVILCDGTDVFDSWRALLEAKAHIESGAGPALISARCVRLGAHSNADAQELYRSKEELAAAEAWDPVARLRAHILEKKILSEKDLVALERESDELLDREAARAEAETDPTPESNAQFVIPPAYDPESASDATTEPPGDGQEKLREAINRTLKEEFRRNEHTFLWGQDVASADKGGVFNLTKGLMQEFGNDRVFNAPIAEDYIIGTANGMSRFDPNIRVVIEAAQFADYVWPGMEQIVEMGHEYWRTKGQFSPNVVLRLASGGYITGGLYHSQNVEAIMSHLPGIRVVYPAFADDASGLLRTAIRSQGPTFFLEPKYIYNRKEARAGQTDENYCIPFGKGRVRREGDDLSIITYGNTVHLALQAAETLAQEGHSVEVFDLRSIKPLDEDGIRATVQKTGKALVLHEDHLFGGIGGEVAAIIARDCFMDLDGPVFRCAAKDIPIGFAPNLEQDTLPNAKKIEAAAREALAF